MSNTRITIELSPREVERLDAWLRTRNAGIVGRPTTRAEETKRILLEEIDIVDRLPKDFWARTGGHSPRVDPDG